MGAVTAAVIAGVATVGSAVAADQAGKRADRSARDARNQAMAQFQGVGAPEVGDMELDMLLPELVGELNPEMTDAIDLGPSAMEELPPEYVDAVMKSMQESDEIAEGGLRDEDKAAFREIQRAVNQDERARQKAILNEMAQRGVAGSGMELAAKLASSQASADRASQAGDRLSSEAAQRALQGINMRANFAGQANQMDSQKAQAKDAISRYNAMNQQNVMNQNVGMRNQAQQQNLAARQAVSDAQKQIQNQQQMHNKGLQQQDFQNQMQIATARAGQHQAQAADAQARGAREAAMWGGIGTGIGNIAGAFMGGSGGKKS